MIPTTPFEEIDVSQLVDLSLRGAALVCGPGATSYITAPTDCLAQLRGQFPVPNGERASTYLELGDKVSATSGNMTEFKTQVENFFRRTVTNPQLKRIVRSPWKAVISLSEDDHLKRELSLYYNSLPTTVSVTAVAHPDVVAETRSIPVYELLGDVSDARDIARLATSTSEYLARRRIWRNMLSTAPDFIKGGVLFFAGTASITGIVADFLNEALALRPSLSTKLVFLHDDPTANDSAIRNLVKNRCTILRVKGNLADFCEAVSNTSIGKAPTQTQLPLTDMPYEIGPLNSVADQCSRVPIAAELSQVTKAERIRLLDILFSPSNLDWSPYAAALDFSRDINPVLKRRIEQVFGVVAEPSQRFIGIRGESGVGKTTALKRIAFDLAQEKYLCLWVRKTYGELSGFRFDAVIKAIERSIGDRKVKVIFFYDDPLSGNIGIPEMYSVLSTACFEWAVVLCVRNSDLANSRLENTQPFHQGSVVEFSDNLSSTEFEGLAAYLAQIGAAKDPQEGTELVRSSASRNGPDILCALWYTLPSTRAAISSSISDEYARLGGVEGMVTSFAEAAQNAMGVARRAYELVATAAGLGIFVPMEVLVRALRIEYSAWVEMCAAHRPLWGLLYDVPYPTAETFAYKTRNDVVTRVLLRLLNGGLATHVGEYRCLKEMLAACEIATPAYHEFLMDVLVRHRAKLADMFSYEQGLELYEAAIRAFPRQDRALAHHKGLWIKNVGHDTEAAYAALEVARNIPTGGRSQEPEGLVYTSMAATVVQAVKENRLRSEDALEQVEELLAKATRPDALNLHSQHVHASLLMELSERLRDTNQQGFLASLQRAARIIDYTLLMVNPEGTRSLESDDGINLLLDLRTQIYTSHLDLGEAKQAARDVFLEKHDQLGFAFVARRMLADAVESNKGAHFKSVMTYIEEAMELIREKKAEPSVELILARAELFIKWRVLRKAGTIDWAALRTDLEMIVRTPRFGKDPLWLFYLAVAQFHLRDYADAEAFFGRIRGMHLPRISRNSFRSVVLDLNGNPEHFQGELQPGADNRRYVFIPDLDTVAVARHGDFSQPMKSTIHCYIVFNMEGPLAVKRLEGALKERGPIDREARSTRPL